MATRSLLPALALLLIAVVCTQQSLGTSVATPSFVISAGTAAPERSPAVPSQAFSKLWTISSDANGELAAIEALTLDLPGQVFITYENATATSSIKQIGSIKVFGETEALIDTVSVMTKRAMHGAKLAVFSTKSPAFKPAANSSSSTTLTSLLIEVVLLRKAALKKVIANGWADVVISDDVLFSKRKEDYTYLFNRALRAAANNTSSITLVETQREVVPRSIGPQTTTPIWTILTPTSSELSNVSIDVQTVGLAFAELNRVDSDFLPDGAIGTVEAVNGNVTVTSTRAADDGRETLFVTSSSLNASAAINLAANVKVGSVTPQFQAGGGIMAPNLNTTFPDDALAVLLNGSGNVFVFANNSAVYVQRATFQVAGSGFMQLEIGAMRAPEGIIVRKDFFGGMSAFDEVTGFVVRDDMTCSWSPSTYVSSVSKEVSDAADAQGKSPRCPVAAVPKKVGGSKPSSLSAPSSGPSKGDSSAPSATGAASQSIGVSLYGVTLTVATVAFAALS